MERMIDYSTGEIVTEDDAWQRHRRIVDLRNQTEQTFLELGKELYWFEAKAQWKQLDYTSFNAYLADPEVDISARTAQSIRSIYEKFFINLKAQPAALIEAGWTKLDIIRPRVTPENVEHWIDLAASLSRSDLKRELEEAFPKEIAPFLEGKYRVIYADPPWKYGNTMPDYFTEQGDHYDLMTIEEICLLPVKDLAGDDSVLFLWVTSPILEEAFQVVKAWGFQYKTSFVWDKVKHCMGHYNSVRHELLLICVRGSCMPDEKTLFDSVVTEERPPRHSQKPEIFRGFIDALYNWGPRIELFARTQSNGWEVWGNESGKKI